MKARRRRARFWGAVKWARRKRARFRSIGPPQAGSTSERCQVWPAAGGLDSGVLARRRRARFRRAVKWARRRRARFWSIGPPQAGSISERCQVWPAAGGLDSGVLARSRLAWFLRGVRCGPQQAGLNLEYWPAAGGPILFACSRMASFLRPAKCGLQQVVLHLEC